jgi:hypothetical protein
MHTDHIQIKVVELVTDVTALASVASPWWLPALANNVTIFFHDTLPIIGWLWIAIQIVFRVYEFLRDRKAKK